MHTQRRWVGPALILVVAVVVGFVAPEVRAQESCPMARKLGRGVANILLGFTEIPLTMIDVNRVHGEVAGATWGFAEGMCMTVKRMLAGVAEVITFPVPFPTDDYDEPLSKPEFPGSHT